jgi:A/G-specific adenine glycosylase
MRDASFQKLVLDYYRAHGRHDLPWRKTSTPYRIVVSEVMLQQTQVSRVIEKYREFLRAFPTFRALASAPTADVLKVWQGLGYNRRALALQRCAHKVVARHKGKLPRDYEMLRTLPGIGPYTAGAILAFAFDTPVPMIETNIRRVYLHHFFPTKKKVSDALLKPIIARHSTRVASAREWYSALMDYGAHLAREIPNPNARSKHYTRQPTFQGSLRQLRGKILRHLTKAGSVEHARLTALMGDERATHVVAALEKEGFIRIAEQIIHLMV